jgi:hypothetical protein
VVVAQLQVPADTTEVTQIKARLDPVGITGMVITADAAHPRQDAVGYLVGRWAGYVFTVKANKPALQAAIRIWLPATSAQTSTERRSGYGLARVRAIKSKRNAMDVRFEYVCEAGMRRELA